MRWWLHIHVTGFEIQSRNCPLRLSDCRQLGAIQKRRYFLLAYLRRCPAHSRLSKICEERYSVVPLLREYFIIHCRTTVCQCFPNKFLNTFRRKCAYYFLLIKACRSMDIPLSISSSVIFKGGRIRKFFLAVNMSRPFSTQRLAMF